MFYFGKKPNLFAFEQPADSLEDAAKKSRTDFYWYIYGGNDYTGFDFSYQPVPWEADFTHVWPDQHQPNGNVYLTRNPTAQHHYHTDSGVHRLGESENWNFTNNSFRCSLDWHRWSPDPASPPYIYHFPSQHQSACGAVYTVPGATEIKLCDDIVFYFDPQYENWEIPLNIDPASIDFTWHPNVLDPPTNYHFPVKWNWHNIGGPVYRMDGATGDKYVDDFTVTTKKDMTNWVVPDNIDIEKFDFSWVPHPKDPPFIYKFPTLWNEVGGPEYHVPGATEEKFIDDLVAHTIPNINNWSIPEEVNVDNVDFSWTPHPKDPPYIYHFSTDYQQSVGLTYTVPGATEIKFAGPVPVKGENRNVLEVLDVFFVDKNNPTAQTRYERLQAKYPNIQKIRYANSIMDTVKRCATRSKTNKFWVISSEYNYDDFDFAWHAQPWQNFMTHVFPSQWQKWSDTFLINKREFERHTEWATGIEQFPNLNFVTNQTVTKPDNLHNIYYVDHGNKESSKQYERLREYHPDLVLTRFVDNYLDTFKRIMSTAETEYVWIINSVCNYSQFDFTWQPEPWQKEMIHVFPSGDLARGDTFYIHVESFKEQMIELDLLDWFNVINYCNDQIVARWPVPEHYYTGDDLIEEIKNYNFVGPYAIFTNAGMPVGSDNICLWTKKDRVVEKYSPSGATVIVPRDIKVDLKTQIYDYPYISKTEGLGRMSDHPDLDIIYLSNGEPDEERWYEWTKYAVHTRPVKWIRNVKGRVAAYQAAAERSTTPWFFMVFAKLAVDRWFDWNWQPDYFQQPKHYIFNSRNPVNGLEYGHQGMIAYNKKLVLANNNPGIDFTLSQPHESVPILSGTTHFNNSPWQAWRTAFREVVKLKHYMTVDPTLETEHRLNVWCTVGEGENADWCLQGATDAIEYYNSVNGDLSALMLTFDWAWLAEYAKKYKFELN